MLSILTAIGTLTLLVSTCNAKSTVESRENFPGKTNPMKYVPFDYCNDSDFCENYCWVFWEDYSYYYYDHCWDWCNENVELNRADTLNSMMKEIKDRNAPAPACICEDYCKVYQASYPKKLNNWIKVGGFPVLEKFDTADDCVNDCKEYGEWHYDDGSS